MPFRSNSLCYAFSLFECVNENFLTLFDASSYLVSLNLALSVAGPVRLRRRSRSAPGRPLLLWIGDLNLSIRDVAVRCVRGCTAL